MTSTIKSFGDLHKFVVSSNEAVVLDIETTGLSPDKFAEIIEIGAVKINIRSKRVIGTFSEFVHPTWVNNIPKKITELTTITWEQVKDSDYIEEVLPRLYSFIGDCPIVAHNAEFDWFRFLLPAFEQVGIHATNEVVCTMKLARVLFPDRGRGGYNLESLCSMYGSHIEGHHRAYVDCKWTASLFLKLLEEYERQYGNMGEKRWKEKLNPLPSSIPVADFSKLRINRISYSPGKTKPAKPKLFVYTNFGTIHYSIDRKLWSVNELRTDENAPAQVWGTQISNIMKASPDELAQKYSQTA